MPASTGGAFWLATAALLRRQLINNAFVEDDHANLCQHARDNWEECIAESNSSTVIRAVLDAAFEDISSLPLNQLASVATVLLEKSLGMVDLQETLVLLGLLRTPLNRRPGLLLLLAHVATHHYTDTTRKLRILEILAWLGDECVNSPAFPAFAEALATSSCATGEGAAPAMPLLQWLLSPAPSQTPLCALKLAGMCCEVSLTATRVCWAPLDSLLRSSQTEEVYYMAAAALFQGLGAHILSFNNNNANSFSSPGQEHPAPEQQEREQERAVGAICDALSCCIPSIQLPAAVAAGRVLQCSQLREEHWARRVYEAVQSAVHQCRGSGNNGGEEVWAGWGQEARVGGVNTKLNKQKRGRELGEVLQMCEGFCRPIMEREK